MQSFMDRYRNRFPQIGLTLAFGFVLFVEDVVFMIFASQQIALSAALLYLYAFSICTILTLWVHYDSRSTGTSLGIDQGMYIFFGWPIMFPVYLFRSRGFRSGGLLLLLFWAIIVFAFMAAFVIALALNIGIAIFSTG